MIIVIQCAKSKLDNAGTLCAQDGRTVRFVAHPELAPYDGHSIYVRPDDQCDRGGSWRQQVSDYNKDPGTNPLNLLPAYQLYRNKVYRELAAKYGLHNVFILSAGWGLIAADFLIPDYDITLNARADVLTRRRMRDKYRDFCMLSNDRDDEIVLFASQSYLPLFVSILQSAANPVTVFYASGTPPVKHGWTLRKYDARSLYTWPYDCAADYSRGNLKLLA